MFCPHGNLAYICTVLRPPLRESIRMADMDIGAAVSATTFLLSTSRWNTEGKGGEGGGNQRNQIRRCTFWRQSTMVYWCYVA